MTLASAHPWLGLPVRPRLPLAAAELLAGDPPSGVVVDAITSPDARTVLVVLYPGRTDFALIDDIEVAPCDIPPQDTPSGFLVRLFLFLVTPTPYDDTPATDRVLNRVVRGHTHGAQS